jgi:hypothetical protein
VAWAADIPGKWGAAPTILFGYTKNLVKSIAAAGGDLVEPFPLYRAPQTCPYVVGRTTLHCSLTPLAEKERAELQSEIGKLRLALARIADEHATFSVIGGNIIVDVEPMLTDEEREAIEWYAGYGRDGLFADTLRSLLERTK